MPALSNPKHERFAQLLAKGYTADAAYSEAGYRPDRKNAARLTTKDDVMTRLAELQERAAIKVDMTVADMLAQLVEDRAFARECNAPSAASSATGLMMKLLGMGVEKREHSGPGGAPIATRTTYNLDGLTDEQLRVLASIPVR